MKRLLILILVLMSAVLIKGRNPSIQPGSTLQQTIEQLKKEIEELKELKKPTEHENQLQLTYRRQPNILIN